MSLPILYSLQHCPYAMRARMGLLMAKQDVLLRAVVTKDKPEEMLAISPKGTVPVLLLDDGTIIDESLEIMLWALNINDPDDLLYSSDKETLLEILSFIHEWDNQLKPTLSAYKHAKRFHLDTEQSLREQCEVYMRTLENRLEAKDYFFGDHLSLADLAILPFVRQFVNCDKRWFREAGYPRLSQWLSKLLQSLLFTKTMRKYPLWQECHKEYLFNWDNLKIE